MKRTSVYEKFQVLDRKELTSLTGGGSGISAALCPLGTRCTSDITCAIGGSRCKCFFGTCRLM